MLRRAVITIPIKPDQYEVNPLNHYGLIKATPCFLIRRMRSHSKNEVDAGGDRTRRPLIAAVFYSTTEKKLLNSSVSWNGSETCLSWDWTQVLLGTGLNSLGTGPCECPPPPITRAPNVFPRCSNSVPFVPTTTNDPCPSFGTVITRAPHSGLIRATRGPQLMGLGLIWDWSGPLLTPYHP